MNAEMTMATRKSSDQSRDRLRHVFRGRGGDVSGGVAGDSTPSFSMSVSCKITLSASH
jgi:hypothetical protein